MNDSNDISLADALSGCAYSVRKSDLEKAARLMAAAFHDDPSVRYLLGGRTQGRDDWRYFLAVLRALYGRCVMLAGGEAMKSLLILFPPQLKSVPTLGFMLNGGLGLAGRFGLPLFRRSINYEGNCQRVRNGFTTPETWYCMCFVVSPEAQGRGLGSELIRPVLDILDAHGAPLYLETHKEINTRIYMHLGFETADVSAIPDTDIKQYAMLRRPRGMGA